MKKKPVAGKMFNEVKVELEAAFESKKSALEMAAISQKLSGEGLDVTAPAEILAGEKFKIGHIHPVSQVQFEVEQIFSDMGFEIMDGPEVESEYYNFEGLNVPGWHPARDMQDTFLLKARRIKNMEGWFYARRLLRCKFGLWKSTERLCV